MLKDTKTSQEHRGGFTLVEMLVSVTLILLMMTMFASIFQMATESLSTHREISERDQKVRQLVTLIRGDIAKRTQRYPLAFYPGEDLDLGPAAPDLREGYFYVSTNDPNCGYDNVLQLTVNSAITEEQEDDTEYYGRAAALIDREAGATSVNLFANPNQPEVDDGSLSPDQTSRSPAAQIVYFVRNGNLYRRVILARKPRRVAGGELGSQPTGRSGNDLLGGLDSSSTYDGFFSYNLGPGATTGNDYQALFDHSAIAKFDPGSGEQSAQLIGIEAFSNKLLAAGAANEAFGNPAFRWGFSQFTGFSREHDNTTDLNFVGRFTQAETSSPNFNWPMNVMVAEGASEASATDVAAGIFGSGNPFSLRGTGMILPGGQELVTALDNSATPGGSGGFRKMEDLLLANVHEFRIELWDERAGRFVVPGYGSLADPAAAVGDFHIRRNLNFDVGSSRFNYGPLAEALGTTLDPYDPTDAVSLLKQPHVFDTWHPNVAAPAGGGRFDFDGDGNIELSETQAPYTTYVVYPPRQTDTPPGPSSPQAPPSSLSVPSGAGMTYRGYWRESDASTTQSYAVGDVVFARDSIANAGWDGDADGSFDWLSDGAVPGSIPDQAFQIGYRCIQDGDAGISPPNWPKTPGKRISEAATGGTAVWQSFDNRRPLKAIRVTIRFINSHSGEPRQLQLVLSLTSGV